MKHGASLRRACTFALAHAPTRNRRTFMKYDTQPGKLETAAKFISEFAIDVMKETFRSLREDSIRRERSKNFDERLKDIHDEISNLEKDIRRMKRARRR